MVRGGLYYHPFSVQLLLRLHPYWSSLTRYYHCSFEEAVVCLKEEVVELVSSCSLLKSVGLITYKSSTILIMLPVNLRKTPSAFFFTLDYASLSG